MLTVAGIGNRYRQDDAIGLRLTQWLATAIAEQSLSGIDTRLWADADALTVAAEICELDGPLLLIDCAEMGLPPGSWRLLPADRADRFAPYQGASAHGFGLADALALIGQLGRQEPISIFAVQPAATGLGEQLTEELTGHLPALCQALLDSVGQLAQPMYGEVVNSASQ